MTINRLKSFSECQPNLSHSQWYWRVSDYELDTKKTSQFHEKWNEYFPLKSAQSQSQSQTQSWFCFGFGSFVFRSFSRETPPKIISQRENYAHFTSIECRMHKFDRMELVNIPRWRYHWRIYVQIHWDFFCAKLLVTQAICDSNRKPWKLLVSLFVLFIQANVWVSRECVCVWKYKEFSQYTSQSCLRWMCICCAVRVYCVWRVWVCVWVNERWMWSHDRSLTHDVLSLFRSNSKSPITDDAHVCMEWKRWQQRIRGDS